MIITPKIENLLNHRKINLFKEINLILEYSRYNLPYNIEANISKV